MISRGDVLVSCSAKTIVMLYEELRGTVGIRVATSVDQVLGWLRGHPATLAVVVEERAGGFTILEATRRSYAALPRMAIVSSPLSIPVAEALAREDLAHAIVVKPWFDGQVRSTVRRLARAQSGLPAAR